MWLVHIYPALVIWPLIFVDAIPSAIRSWESAVVMAGVSILIGHSNGQFKWGVTYAVFPILAVTLLGALSLGVGGEGWFGDTIRVAFGTSWVLWLTVWMISPVLALISRSVQKHRLARTTSANLASSGGNPVPGSHGD